MERLFPATLSCPPLYATARNTKVSEGVNTYAIVWSERTLCWPYHVWVYVRVVLLFELFSWETESGTTAVLPPTDVGLGTMSAERASAGRDLRGHRV